MSRKRCYPGTHTDRRMRGGARVRCTTCGDVFPCRHECEHADCAAARERPLPAWITVEVPLLAR